MSSVRGALFQASQLAFDNRHDAYMYSGSLFSVEFTEKLDKSQVIFVKSDMSQQKFVVGVPTRADAHQEPLKNRAGIRSLKRLVCCGGRVRDHDCIDTRMLSTPHR